VTPQREFLRHTLATLAYRGGKVVRDAPPGFGETRVYESARSAIQVLAHIGDLLDWAAALAAGKEVWHDTAPQSWEDQVKRFFDGLSRFDHILASDTPLKCPEHKLFQGPIADALWHVGQIAALRCLAGSPVRGENYFKAEIVIGRVGPEQSARRSEFD
jgi:hypothetical protein